MQGVVSEKHIKQNFNPFFVAHIGGQQEQISLKQFKENWTKYINSKAGFMYQNAAELRRILKANKAKNKETLKINPEAMTRGVFFDKKGQESKIEEFEKKQIKARNKARKQLKKLHELKVSLATAKEETGAAKVTTRGKTTNKK